MDPVIVGAAYVSIPFLFFPFCARIIYIFLSRKKYRSLECYKIMAQMGISQCISMVPTFIAFGFTLILQNDYFGIADFIIKLCPAFQRTESCLCFVLALNRLKIITNFGFPNFVHKGMIVGSWLLGLTILIFLFFPCCIYGIFPGKLRSQPMAIALQPSPSSIPLPTFRLSCHSLALASTYSSLATF